MDFRFDARVFRVSPDMILEIYEKGGVVRVT